MLNLSTLKKVLPLSFLFTSFYFNCLNAQVNVQDSLALVSLFNSTNGAHWNNKTNWLSNKPVSSWYGITVSSNRVTVILLNSNNLQGFIPSAIGNLSAVTAIYLKDNLLENSIPASISGLQKLNFLIFSGNRLSGKIPALKNLPQLIILDLSKNQLTGSIPPILAQMPNLQYLTLSNNQLTGTIPSSFENKKSLLILDVGNNKLKGAFPQVITTLINLQTLYLNNNNFNGTLPSALGNLNFLQQLDLSNNNFSGDIPSTFANPNFVLLMLNLSNNHFTNALPLKSQSNIFINNLSNNKFTFDGLQQLAVLLGNDSVTNNYSPQALISVNLKNNILSVSAGGTLNKNTYQWYRNNNVYKTTVGDSTLTVTMPGIYYVKVFNSVAQQLSLKSKKISVQSLKTNNNNQLIASTNPAESALVVSPNPFKNVFNLSANIALKNASIIITDVSGKTLYAAKQNLEKSKNLQINAAAYATGEYFIHIQSAGETYSIKIMKY